MALVFNPPIPPQEGPQASVKFNMTEVRLGEGYTVSMGEGLNPKIQTWPLTWKGTEAEVQPIADFFDDHEGYKRFLWTPPNGVQGYYAVKEYSYIPSAAGNLVLTATLEQRFAP